LYPKEIGKRVKAYLEDARKTNESGKEFLKKKGSHWHDQQISRLYEQRRESLELCLEPNKVDIWELISGTYYVLTGTNEPRQKRDDLGIFRGRFLDVLVEAVQMSRFYPCDFGGYPEKKYNFLDLGYIIKARINDIETDKSLEVWMV